jgi:hypothetical protein
MAEERRFDGSEGDVGAHRLQIDGKDVPLLGVVGRTKRPWLLYVRAAGRALCDLIESSVSDKEKVSMDRYAVTGTPGTGKSAFASYFVARQLAMGKTVYYMWEKQGLVLETSTVGRPARATRYGEESLLRFKTLVEDANAADSWCVLDSLKANGAWLLPTLVVTSPKVELYEEWIKQGEGRTCYMPLPTFEECRELSSALGTGMDDAALKERIKVGGYVFRYVVDGAWTLEELRLQAGAAVRDADFGRLKKCMRGVKIDSEINSRVVHVDVPLCAIRGWQFDRPEYQFASDFVSELVCKIARYKLDDDTWWAMLNGIGQWKRHYNPLLFEEMAQRRLCRPGAQVRIRRVAGPATYDPATCEDDGSYLLTISARELEVKTFATIANVLPNRSATLWIPSRHNFEAIDGVLFQKDAESSFYLQCTATQGIRADNWADTTKMVEVAHTLADLWRDSFGNEPLRLLYVVPHSLWLEQ